MKRRAKRLLNDLDGEIREHIELAVQENISLLHRFCASTCTG